MDELTSVTEMLFIFVLIGLGFVILGAFAHVLEKLWGEDDGD
jgi:hypothetical protein